MEVKGIIENGKRIKEIVEFECIKCGNNVCLEFNPAMQENTYQLFLELVTDKLCLDCHCNKKVPELAECLVN